MFPLISGIIGVILSKASSAVGGMVAFSRMLDILVAICVFLGEIRDWGLMRCLGWRLNSVDCE